MLQEFQFEGERLRGRPKSAASTATTGCGGYAGE
jgi:hypothetical protein